MAFPSALLTEQPDSPDIVEDREYRKVTRIYKANARLTQTQLEQGEYVPTDGYIDPETGAEYKRHSYSSEVGYPVLNVEFEKRLSYEAEYDQHTHTYERTIEQHPSFKQNWHYELFASDTTTAVPAWWATATDKSDTLKNDTFAWSKTGSPQGYPYLVKEVSLGTGNILPKKGISHYLAQTSIVTKRKVYTVDGAVLQRWPQLVGQLMEPYRTYGLLGSGTEQDKYWLIRDVRIVEDQGSFACTVEFMFAPDAKLGKGWDTDIYSISGFEDDK